MPERKIMKSPSATDRSTELEQVLRTATVSGDEIAGLMATIGFLLNRCKERLDAFTFHGTAIGDGASLLLFRDVCQMQSVAMGLGKVVTDLIRATRLELSDVLYRSSSTGTEAISSAAAVACNCTLQLLAAVESALHAQAKQVEQDTMLLRESVARMEAQGDASALANEIISRAQRHRD
jgi:hypothetical protein